MSMDGLKLIIGPSPCEMDEEERLVFASKEVERMGIALQTHIEKEKQKKARKARKGKKEDTKVLLNALQAAGLTLEEYVELMKGKSDVEG